MEELLRTEMLFGKEKVEKLKSKRVIVFGIGGVGGYVCEVLARTGIGQIDLVDNDTVSLSNINRQIIALHSTVGRYKVDVMKERIHDINPNITVNAYNTFFMPETASEIDLSVYDYVVDAIDTVKGKIALAEICTSHSIPIIASMGPGNKLNPEKLQISDISKTSVCPLARVMRKKIKDIGVKKYTVLWSDEIPIVPSDSERTPASVSFVPPVAGIMIAGRVIRDLINI